jgi:hypothetical protein
MGDVANPNDSFTRFIRCYFYLSTNKQIFAGVGMSDQGGTYQLISIVCVTIILILHSLLLSR